MDTEYYEQKSIHYGMGHTRLKRILALAGDVSNKKVLDAGCAGGNLGAHFKSKGAYVIGLDLSSEAVREARHKLNEAYVTDVGGPWPEELGPNSFDIVILAEVLEHVFEPVKTLHSAYRFLKPDGKLIITTPNFMTWTNRLKFLFGRFEYTDQGMFDFGHIRFFTWTYLKSVLKDSGFKIIEDKSIIFPGKLTAILKYWPSLFAWQFVVKAQKI